MAQSSTIYLDYSAATPLDPQVLKDMAPYFSDKFYNPSSIYSSSRQVKKDLNQARSKIAQILGAKQSEIIFTAGGTEANNLAIFGVAFSHSADAHFVSSAIEHDSVLKPLDYLQKNGRSVSFIKPNHEGLLNPADVLTKVKDETVLVSIIYANNEVGTIQPIKEIAKGLAKIRADRQKKKIKTPLYFHTDACQAANYLDLHVNKLGIDLMTINGGKIYGPKQSGALYVSSHVNIEPIIYGGGQEDNRRSGSENIPASLGLASALDKAQKLKPAESRRLSELQDFFVSEISKKIPNAIINGSLKQRLPNNLHLTIPGQDNERLLFALDEKGIQAAAGAACSASKEEPSHVLKAMGKSDDYARSSLRLTMGRGTDKKQLINVIDALTDLL